MGKRLPSLFVGAGKSRGLTIVEVLVATAVASMLGVIVMSLINSALLGTNAQQFALQRHALNEDIRSLLGDTQSCTKTFGGLNVSQFTSPNVYTVPSLKDSAGNVKYLPGGANKSPTYEDGSTYIDNMQLDTYTPSPTLNTAVLHFVYGSAKQVSGRGLSPDLINLQIVSNGAGVVTSCIALAKMQDGLWQIVPNTSTDIYYMAGNVGVGTSKPSDQFHVYDNRPGGASVKIEDTTNGPDGLQLLNDGYSANWADSLRIKQDSAGNAIFSASKVLPSQLVLSPNGNVGIGTIPGATFQVSSAGSTNVQLDGSNGSSNVLVNALGGNSGAYLQLNAPNGVGTSEVNLISRSVPSYQMTNLGVGSKASLYNDGFTHLETNSEVIINQNSNQNLSLNAGGGLVGVGTTNPGTNLDVQGPLWPEIRLTNTSLGTMTRIINDGWTHIESSNTLSINLFTNQNVSLAGGGGKVGIGTWNPQYQMHLYTQPGYGYVHEAGGARMYTVLNGGVAQLGTSLGNIQFYANDNSGGPIAQFMSNGAGTGLGMLTHNIMNAGNIWAQAYFYASDRNLKKDIQPLEAPLDKLLQLNGVQFKWKKDDRPDIGLIAQEVEKVYPELVHESETGTNDPNVKKIKTVEYGNIVAIVIEAVKEVWHKLSALIDRVTALENQVLELRRENQELKDRLSKIEQALQANALGSSNGNLNGVLSQQDSHPALSSQSSH